MKYYTLEHLSLATPDNVVWSNEENAEKKINSALLSLTSVCWRTDFTIEDIYVWYHTGSSISSILKHDFGINRDYVSEPTYVTKDGKQYCVSDIWHYLHTATQDQVDISNYIYGRYRERRSHRRFDWTKCLILWKDDFFRIANPEVMDKDWMLMLYLGIFATGFQDEGIGSIDGYQIADYQSFAQVATKEQLDAINADIEHRMRCVSIWSRMRTRDWAFSN